MIVFWLDHLRSFTRPTCLQLAVAVPPSCRLSPKVHCPSYEKCTALGAGSYRTVAPPPAGATKFVIPGETGRSPNARNPQLVTLASLR
jgi:hypothetical protein